MSVSARWTTKLIIEERLGLPSVLYKDGGRLIILEEMSKAIDNALRQIKGILQPILPVGATSKLQASLTIDSARGIYKGNRIEGRMYNKGYAKRYAGVVELGRKSGSRRPPIAPLKLWLKKKKGLSEKEASRAAYGLSIHISREGTKPQLQWARNTPRFKLIAERELKMGLVRVLKRIKLSPRAKRRFGT